eukprot:4332590-Heterocapsa_arctica.AAC.1
MERVVTPSACLVALDRPQTTALYKLSTPESQGKVEVMQTLIGKLAMEQSPDIIVVQAPRYVLTHP